MSDLKPCPFCGCQVTPRDRFNIKCEGCGVEMNALPHLLEAQWNARHLSDVPQGVSVTSVSLLTSLGYEALHKSSDPYKPLLEAQCEKMAKAIHDYLTARATTDQGPKS